MPPKDRVYTGTGFKGAAGSQKPITPAMVRAAGLSALGWGRDRIAEELDINPSTVSRWLQRDDVRQIRAAELNNVVAAMVPKAYAVLQAQLDSSNPWVAQGAARELIRLYGVQQGQSDANVVVTFGSMPKPGVPASAGHIAEETPQVETEFSE